MLDYQYERVKRFFPIPADKHRTIEQLEYQIDSCKSFYLLYADEVYLGLMKGHLIELRKRLEKINV